ncbi:predicted protein [Histoplasma capsulatum H143]|uniref:Uncharacterized protein n=1 Tax=Ajellomyces capsulatus (strain H143) TaxID=544712 RepID=C6HNM5_AJECH|nr:predicted protein [Histoplasma capsulatum H143]
MDDEVIRTTSACASPILEMTSINDMPLEQTLTSQPTPNRFAHLCQSESHSSEPSIQPQTPAALKPTVVAESNDSSSRKHRDTLCSSVQHIAQPALQPTILNPDVISEHRTVASSAQMLESSQRLLGVECQPSALASTSTGAEGPSAEGTCFAFMNSYDYSDEEDAVSRFWFLR